MTEGFDGAAHGERERLQQIQVGIFTQGDPDLLEVRNPEDPEEILFLCDPHYVLLADRLTGAPSDEDDEDDEDDQDDDRPSPEGGAPDEDPVAMLDDYFSGRMPDGTLDPDSERGLDPDDSLAPGVLRYRLPARTDGQTLLVTLAEVLAQFGPHFAEPDYFVHIAGKICPATEPSVPHPPQPSPDLNPDLGSGAGVKVVVVDSGWHEPAEKLPWMRGVTGEPEPQTVYDAQGNIRVYAGHGTFVAGVIRSVARACEVHVLSLHVDAQRHGGGVRASELVARLDAALALEPHLINLSAGTMTLNNQRPRIFRAWWRRARVVNPDLVLVAAAGNDGRPVAFWPASFRWAVGVGSLDADGTRSDFSNHGPSIEAFARGRDLVNAFPNGQYHTQELPVIGEERIFDQMLATWSGTSFSTPVVTGLIAAKMTEGSGMSARDARDAVLRGGLVPRPGGPPSSYLLPPYPPVMSSS